MKIREIMLIAYGPFTDVRIDLREGEEGLHIIYGPNEAGKSSALRALRSMLFGIPERTSDDFLHPYTKMRVGAAMQSADGDVLECVRLKGRSSTLRAVDEKTILDESILHQFLKGVDADLFASMFGIDNAELVRGGKEIIQGGGPMGRIIFAAGSGVANLRAVQEELKSEVALLFKPWGQKPRINATLHKLNKIRKVLRDAQLPGREWVNHDQALQEAQERKQTVDQELARKQRDRHRLERIRAALPMIAERNALLEELKEYASAAVLSENFGEKRRELITRLRIAESNRNQAIQNMEMLKKEMAKIQVNESLLEKSEFIEAAYQELGSHRKAAVDRDKLLARKDILRGEAKDILHGLHDDVKLEDADKLRVNRTDRVRIQELGNQFERIITRMENSQDAIPNLTYGIDKIDIQLKALDAPKGVDPLKDLLVEAEELGALEKRCREDQREIRNDLKTLEMHIKKQPLWSGAMEELESLPVPSLDSIDMFEDRIYKAEGALRDLTSEKMNVQDNLATIEKQIGELRHEQDVPTEEDLQHARDKRSQGWRFIQSRLQGDLIPDEEVHDFMQWFQPSSTLAEAFEASVLQADDIADRLRRDADHVAALENLLAEKSAQKKQFQGLKKDVDAAEKGLSEIRDKWAQLWQPSGIMPLSPREMRGWAQTHMAMAAKATEIRGRKSKVDALQENIEKQRKALDQCLQSLYEPRASKDETLAALIKRGRKVCEKQEKLRNERKKLLTEKEQKEKDLAEAMSRVDKSREELSQWQRQWERTVRPLGLDADSKPSQANAVIEDLKSLFEKLKEADILEKRIKGIDRDTLEFDEKVANLVKNVAKDLADLPADQSAIELNIMLTKSRAAQTRLQTYERQWIEENDRLGLTGKEIAEIETRLKGMCEEAGCENYEDLPEAERRSEKRCRIESDIKNLEEQLHKLSAGATIDDFVKEALKEDPDDIDTETDRLTEEIHELTSKRSKLDQTIGKERNELSKMDGTSRAADLAEETQMLLGSLENDVEQYARLRLASVVLHQAIERYRKKNQASILKRTNSFFKQMTRGSFEGVRPEFDDNGQPVLVGVRPGRKDIVDLEGMSDGTADQLYLSLRLAGLEEYLERNEPMPFIVDDILIKFDDDRASAALIALAQLSARTQVIFFTHHRHMVELAEKNIDPSILMTHTLNA